MPSNSSACSGAGSCKAASRHCRPGFQIMQRPLSLLAGRREVAAGYGWARVIDDFIVVTTHAAVSARWRRPRLRRASRAEAQLFAPRRVVDPLRLRPRDHGRVLGAPGWRALIPERDALRRVRPHRCRNLCRAVPLHRADTSGRCHEPFLRNSGSADAQRVVQAQGYGARLFKRLGASSGSGATFCTSSGAGQRADTDRPHVLNETV